MKIRRKLISIALFVVIQLISTTAFAESFTAITIKPVTKNGAIKIVNTPSLDWTCQNTRCITRTSGRLNRNAICRDLANAVGAVIEFPNKHGVFTISQLRLCNSDVINNNTHYYYEAVLWEPPVFQGVWKANGVEWFCGNRTCRLISTRSRPSINNCRDLSTFVGKIMHFGHSRSQLTSYERNQCNRNLVKLKSVLQTPLTSYWNHSSLDNASVSRLGRGLVKKYGYRKTRIEGQALERSLSFQTPALELWYHSGRRDYYTTATRSGKQTAREGGYTLKGVQGYVFAEKQPGTVALKLFYHKGRKDNFTTATEIGERTAIESGYGFARVEGYVYPAR